MVTKSQSANPFGIVVMTFSAQDHRSPGARKINWSFEEQVVAQLVLTAIEEVDSVAQAVVVANVAYSHDIIRQASARRRSKAPDCRLF